METLEEWEIGDLLAQLVEKSLAVFVESENRYRLLESMRAFAAGRLDETEPASPCRSRHAGCFLDLAEEAEPHLTGPEQAAWQRRLDAEQGNLRAALEATLAAGGDAGPRICASLVRWWLVRGLYAEGRVWLKQALALASEPAITAKLLNGAGLLAWRQGDLEEARHQLRGALDIQLDLKDDRGVAVVLNNLGLIAYAQEDYPAAVEFQERSLTMCRKLGDPRRTAIALANVAAARMELDELEAAEGQLREAHGILCSLGDEWSRASILSNLGCIAARRQRADEARSLLAESAELWSALGDRSSLAGPLIWLGGLDSDSGYHARAIELIRTATVELEAANASMPATDRVVFDRVELAARPVLGSDRVTAMLKERRRRPLAEVLADLRQ